VKPSGSPAQGVVVVMDGDEMQGLTAANGMARLSINTVKNPEPITITVSVVFYYLDLNVIKWISLQIKECRLMKTMMA